MGAEIESAVGTTAEMADADEAAGAPLAEVEAEAEEAEADSRFKLDDGSPSARACSAPGKGEACPPLSADRVELAMSLVEAEDESAAEVGSLVGAASLATSARADDGDAFESLAESEEAELLSATEVAAGAEAVAAGAEAEGEEEAMFPALWSGAAMTKSAFFNVQVNEPDSLPFESPPPMLVTCPAFKMSVTVDTFNLALLLPSEPQGIHRDCSGSPSEGANEYLSVCASVELVSVKMAGMAVFCCIILSAARPVKTTHKEKATDRTKRFSK